MLQGEAKKTYQREYMRHYMRKYRSNHPTRVLTKQSGTHLGLNKVDGLPTVKTQSHNPMMVGYVPPR